MSALDQLERQLCNAVDAGAAAPGHVPVDPPSVSASWRRWIHGPRMFLALLAMAAAATGAIAATGYWRIERESPGPFMAFAPDTGQGVRSSKVHVLPLRVADPLGGPPWALRTFSTSRGAACVQAGQLYRGRFGRVERDAAGKAVFQLVGIHLGDTARCTNRVVDGLPVMNGLRMVRIDGGEQSRQQCSDGGSHRACPIRAVTVVRYGLLGPNAQRVRWLGHRSVSQTALPGTGGAYLLARQVDPEPWRAQEHLARSIREEAERRVPVVQQAGKSPRARRSWERQWRKQAALLSQLYRQHRVEQRRIWRRTLAAESIEAAFTTGERFIVAGRGAARRTLPGVPIIAEAVPRNLATPIRVRVGGPRDDLQVAFRAPVALSQMAEAYRVTVRGPKAPACAAHERSTEFYVDRDTAQGALIRVTLPHRQAGEAPEPRGHWCPGRRYALRVFYVRSGGKPIERLLGERSIVPQRR